MPGACGSLGNVEIVIADAAARRATPWSRSGRKPSPSSAPRPAGSLAGHVAKASYLGTHMEYSIETAAGTLFATCPHVERPLGPGADVGLLLTAQRVIIIVDD